MKLKEIEAYVLSMCHVSPRDARRAEYLESRRARRVAYLTMNKLGFSYNEIAEYYQVDAKKVRDLAQNAKSRVKDRVMCNSYTTALALFADNQESLQPYVENAADIPSYTALEKNTTKDSAWMQQQREHMLQCQKWIDDAHLYPGIIEWIEREVADEYGIAPRDLACLSRETRYSEARQMAAKLIQIHTKTVQRVLAQRYNRERSSIAYMASRCVQFCRYDPCFNERFERVSQRVSQRVAYHIEQTKPQHHDA